MATKKFEIKTSSNYISLAGSPGMGISARTEELEPNVFVDYDSNGRVMGIEILAPIKIYIDDSENNNGTSASKIE